MSNPLQDDDLEANRLYCEALEWLAVAARAEHELLLKPEEEEDHSTDRAADEHERAWKKACQLRTAARADGFGNGGVVLDLWEHEAIVLHNAIVTDFYRDRDDDDDDEESAEEKAEREEIERDLVKQLGVKDVDLK